VRFDVPHALADRGQSSAFPVTRFIANHWRG
jgi:hypothetical protein